MFYFRQIKTHSPLNASFHWPAQLRQGAARGTLLTREPSISLRPGSAFFRLGTYFFFTSHTPLWLYSVFFYIWVFYCPRDFIVRNVPSAYDPYSSLALYSITGKRVKWVRRMRVAPAVSQPWNGSAGFSISLARMSCIALRYQSIVPEEDFSSRNIFVRDGRPLCSFHHEHSLRVSAT